MKTEIGKRSKTEMFLVLLTDAVASTYPTAGLRSDKAVSIETLRAKLDAAGLLEDCGDDPDWPRR
jgi:hypothetical protein